MAQQADLAGRRHKRGGAARGAADRGERLVYVLSPSSGCSVCARTMLSTTSNHEG
jgi:hypothetical protein